MNLFIDSNIWLSLYDFSDDNLSQFEKLKTYKDHKIKLFIPQQVVDEVYRNRDNKLNSTYKNFQLKIPKFPNFTKPYPEYNEFKDKMEDLDKKFNEWKDNIHKDIINNNLSADKTIEEFFNQDTILECSDDIIKKAYNRFTKGNPPGKNNSFGDAINWETLLKYGPNEDLYFITSDKDFVSDLSKNEFNYLLKKEWNNNKGGNIIFYSSLYSFFKDKLEDIELEISDAKGQLINNLLNSESFAYTHIVIKNLNEYSDWSYEEVYDLCNCVLQNDQVGRILLDYDVRDFYETILKSQNDDILYTYPFEDVANRIGVYPDNHFGETPMTVNEQPYEHFDY
ncbi:PIN domain-containing protein [Anaerococcus degeneri]|uniref:PIN domain-containing protein n=1 Tax=Anaerococcus degeneri TaxID=361500 RepID=A0ABS7YW87_9FIRM|nr:PIN domain-containing protein [Anaerococcus degeneri]MBP2015574.1 hypothetical protein [Anaerococcus degeneri]MCA2095928.1 PIN domain-containing protein [Anaerococcus degeneri]